MRLPWWLAHFEPASLREVLELFGSGASFVLTDRLGRIAEALLKNDYASGAFDIERSGAEVTVRVESALLLDGGNALLRSLGTTTAGMRSTAVADSHRVDT